MTLFYIGAGIGLVLAVIYLIVGTLSFLRIRRELAAGTGIDAFEEELDSSEVALVPGFTWKATLAVLTSLVLLIIASYSGAFWYVLAYIVITFGAAALQGLYKAPIYELFITTWDLGSFGSVLADVVTVIINTAISFWVFFPIFKVIFRRVPDDAEAAEVDSKSTTQGS